MTQLRRTTTLRGMPMRALELNAVCDVCQSHRAHGNHHRCSKIRQARMRGEK